MDGEEFKSACLGTIGCVCVRCPNSMQRANGLGLIGQLCGCRWYTCSVGRLGTTCDACPTWAKEASSCQHLAMPACSDDSASDSTEKSGNVACRSLGLGHHPSKRRGGRTRSRNRSRLQRGRQPGASQESARPCGFPRMRAVASRRNFNKEASEG